MSVFSISDTMIELNEINKSYVTGSINFMYLKELI